MPNSAVAARLTWPDTSPAFLAGDIIQQIDVRQDGFDALIKPQACWGEFHRSAAALNELDGKVLFKARNVTAHPGFRHPQVISSGTDATKARHGMKADQSRQPNCSNFRNHTFN